MQAISIAVSPGPPDPTTVLPEFHLPPRPYFGKAEQTRLSPWITSIAPLFASRFRTQLKSLLLRHKATAVHILTHYAESMDAVQAAHELNLPYYLCVHDDFAYILTYQSRLRNVAALIARLTTAWNDAADRFVISPEMGEEYCTRYGRRSYHIVTDGLEAIAPAPRPLPSNSLRVYFMGLFHHAYAANLQSLVAAMDALQQQRPDLNVSLTLRCGGLPATITAPRHLRMSVLPFGSEKDVAVDMESADLLYMPLPFAERNQNFARFSLSTKMITYLGSGLPILYHGPIAESAAGRLLQNNGAAICLDSLDPLEIQRSLAGAPQQYNSVTRAALTLASARFRLADTQQRFWDPILAGVSV
jgi:hypothetical protein